MTEVYIVPNKVTQSTYLFLHVFCNYLRSDLSHLIGNMYIEEKVCMTKLIVLEYKDLQLFNHHVLLKLHGLFAIFLSPGFFPKLFIYNYCIL